MNVRNHYEVIGVPPTATTDEIKRKYRELARKFHPDIVQDKEMGQKVFSQINQAYGVLADPEKRSQYDMSLGAANAAPVSPVPQSRAAGQPVPSQPVNGSAPTIGVAIPQAALLTEQQRATITRQLADADLAVMQNKMGNAKLICENVLKADPRNVKALSILGDALAQMGKPREAAAAYRQALQITPSSLLQAKLSRLTGTPAPGAASQGARPATPPPYPPPAARPAQPPPEEKPSGGLLGRILGRK